MNLTQCVFIVHVHDTPVDHVLRDIVRAMKRNGIRRDQVVNIETTVKTVWSRMTCVVEHELLHQGARNLWRV